MTHPLPGVRRPMVAVLTIGSVVFLLAMPVAAAIGYAIAGSAGAWGAFLGIAIPVVFFTMTVLVAVFTVRVSPNIFGAVVLGSWIVKLIALIVALYFLRDADFYDRPIFFFAFLIGTAAYLILEALIVVRTRVPYVDLPTDALGTRGSSRP